MAGIIKIVFFLLFVKPLALIVIGLSIRNKELLPVKGPAIIAANHNSHLDTLVLLSLYPLSKISRVRPVAAQDYFFQNRALKWFALYIMGILPIARKVERGGPDPLEICDKALANDQILIIFPEGSRGKPEKISEFKNGLAKLVHRNPNASVTPVFLDGLGKSLPKGAFLPVPFFCHVNVGEKIHWEGHRKKFTDKVFTSITNMAKERSLPVW
ncbi:MAG: lysophospholipid acyltransferase family protein [Leptospirales bacterium]